LQRTGGGASVSSAGDPSPYLHSVGARSGAPTPDLKRKAEGTTTEKHLKRMEDDRDRHRKVKEENWTVHHEAPGCIFDRVGLNDDEIENAWDVVGDWDDVIDGEALRVEVERLKVKKAVGSEKNCIWHKELQVSSRVIEFICHA
jgi:hypothetical protein